MDRFVDNGMMLVNFELRFPGYRRLQGVFGYDAGQVWHTPDQWRANGFHSNPDIGLRFVMETFVVRLDVGMSSENTGL
jgi:hemolysin activation/secretion protein